MFIRTKNTHQKSGILKLKKKIGARALGKLGCGGAGNGFEVTNNTKAPNSVTQKLNWQSVRSQRAAVNYSGFA